MSADLLIRLNGAERRAKALMNFLGLKGSSSTTLLWMVDCCNDSAAEITRLRAELAEAREVKSLAWGPRNDEDAHPDELVAGDYAIWAERHQFELLFWSIPIGRFGALRDAQAFANSHHTSRILAALKGGA
ncbi:hypothetical protein [Ketogulonicigenium vulgare]|uniref:Uncharacterized protein n=1 Tax=Ketogulonicigenium vulgare (strain WSH-001) TaxID=759362 RepID=F9Y4I9_KETVW|nr:hypothetical protein [Ketogulonicigenium vulgare]ADO42352.1 hypothetical protein EIO_1209 [Ketogulonicigenium vulgare Y25]AEM40546.1 hypothetical protein KVU_0707 [Ketogulonicigenium vulgare WSH-001]ALJ80733.1 hypothetical protein KVH_05765 [Ketogulonicigenium vulgare]ANW33534.1 hypothetical protein KvSKV_05735 [Ketogulonicigenium vulgare]AOZ54264.1 hypothetical protein KVC_1247 [Ketogulonicigenium vulgare]